MQSIEDSLMQDAPASSTTASPMLLKQTLQQQSHNGVAQRNISATAKSAGTSITNSRATSVLTTKANNLTLGALYESSDSDDELADIHGHGEPLPFTSAKTGLCYDARMRFHTELSPPKDRSDYHPEDPRRILFIYRELCEAGLVDDKNMSIHPLASNPVLPIMARPATKPEVCLVHDDAHFEFVKSTSDKPEDELLRLEATFDSIYFHRLTYSTALLSAGAAIETCLAVASGKVKNAIAVIRPPGHHAECDTSRGFCHFDNVSIATQVVRQTYPDQYRKILIVDWDVHHGNGIQQAFESNPNVLYISIHVHENGNFYPAGPYGDLYHCGEGPGIGKNINIPWPTKGMGNADYLFAFQHVIMPVAFDFSPDLVIIAAGFDAAEGDQLGGCFVTPACYGHMTHMLMSLANGKVVVCLEGGYNLRSISKSALAVTKTLMGEPPERIPETAATDYGVDTVRRVVLQQSRYWKCLYPKGDFTYIIGVMIAPGAERMHDVVRAYQSKHLHESHKMINLWVFRERISRSFDHQVLATANYGMDIPLLVIFHDPPEIMGVPNPTTNKLDLHSTWLADHLKTYIEWAVNRGFGVIDVNIPKFLTGISVSLTKPPDKRYHYLSKQQDPDGDEEKEALKLKEATEELAIYLWDNYIEPNESPKVIFLGVGEAFKAVLHILNTRNYEALAQIAGIVGFASEHPIRPVAETFITDFAKWYYKRSLLFVAADHPVWARDKKPSKKFGALKRSHAAELNAMLLAHAAEVQEFLVRRAEMPAVVGRRGGRKIVEEEEDEDAIMVAAGR
ncbi:Histone deacetylase hda1 [Lambiella insularis]|nr:Histone deacetylase hda1 [Lambiella insularis]